MRNKTGTSHDFLEVLLKGSSRSAPELLLVFAFGILAITLVGNWLYDLLTGGFSRPVVETLQVWGGAVVSTIIARAMWAWFVRKQEIVTRISEASDVAPRRGLVWVLSPSRLDHLLFAIRQHLPKLQRVWLIVTAERAIQERLAELRAVVSDEGWAVALEPVQIPLPNALHTRKATEQIYQELIAGAGMNHSDVISDITGGTKPMTAGMVLACYLNGWAMEYVGSRRNYIGDPLDEKVLVSIKVGSE